MKEIDFRIWNHSTERMLYQSNIKYSKCTVEIVFDDTLLGEKKDIMQYIEMQGKNKVKMYKGDIFLYNKEKYIVSLHKGAWIANQVDKSFFFNLFTECSVKKVNKQYYCDEYEVIGNIYETPELLQP